MYYRTQSWWGRQGADLFLGISAVEQCVRSQPVPCMSHVHLESSTLSVLHFSPPEALLAKVNAQLVCLFTCALPRVTGSPYEDRGFGLHQHAESCRRTTRGLMHRFFIKVNSTCLQEFLSFPYDFGAAVSFPSFRWLVDQ